MLESEMEGIMLYLTLSTRQGIMPPAEVALRFVLDSPKAHVAIPATSSVGRLESNIAVSDGKGLPEDIDRQIRACYRRAVNG